MLPIRLGPHGATFTPIEPEAGYRWFDGAHGKPFRSFYPSKVNLTKDFAIFTDNADGNGYSS